MNMVTHKKVDYGDVRIQQSPCNYGKVSLVATIAENRQTGDDLIVWLADSQDEVDSHWLDALRQFGPTIDEE